MIIAYLDILAFTYLLKEKRQVASDFLCTLYEKIKEKIINKIVIEKNLNKIEEKKIFFFGTRKSDYVDSFQYLINFSDSLVIASNNPELFIKQLTNFIGTLNIIHLKEFIKTIDESTKINNTKIADVKVNGDIEYHEAFPLFLRGGITIGEDIEFINNSYINNSSLQGTLNITGKTYLEAVTLENSGKGPRIFCNKNLINAISDKQILNIIKQIDDNLYEIVWTIPACEAIESNIEDKYQNVRDKFEKMLLPAIHLFKHNKKDKSVREHYEEFVKLVCCGLIKYAKDKCNKEKETLEFIKRIFEQEKIDIPININSNFLA